MASLMCFSAGCDPLSSAMLAQHAIWQFYRDHIAGIDAYSEGALSMQRCAGVRQGTHGGTALSSLYRSMFSLVHTPTQVPIRYVGVFTDGGARDSLQQFGVDNMCAPKFTLNSVHA